MTHRLGRRVDSFAHSLGCALLFEAMADAPDAAVRRAVLLGPAARRGAGRRIASMRPDTEFLHVVARANDIFDEACHRLIGDRGDASDPPLGFSGAGGAFENWLDIQIDHDATRAWLAARGLGPPARARMVCHRLFYEDDAAMALYRDVFHHAAPSCFAKLRADGAPLQIARRWSRIGEVPRLGSAFFQKLLGGCFRRGHEAGAHFESSGPEYDSMQSI
ncbi:MAG: hypothetical protein AAF360_00720 [Pseudomonadota bacterium]